MPRAWQGNRGDGNNVVIIHKISGGIHELQARPTTARAEAAQCEHDDPDGLAMEAYRLEREADQIADARADIMGALVECIA